MFVNIGEHISFCVFPRSLLFWYPVIVAMVILSFYGLAWSAIFDRSVDYRGIDESCEPLPRLPTNTLLPNSRRDCHADVSSNKF